MEEYWLGREDREAVGKFGKALVTDICPSHSGASLPYHISCPESLIGRIALNYRSQNPAGPAARFRLHPRPAQENVPFCPQCPFLSPKSEISKLTARTNRDKKGQTGSEPGQNWTDLGQTGTKAEKYGVKTLVPCSFPPEQPGKIGLRKSTDHLNTPHSSPFAQPASRADKTVAGRAGDWIQARSPRKHAHSRFMFSVLQTSPASQTYSSL